jgi:hypothetical protein
MMSGKDHCLDVCIPIITNEHSSECDLTTVWECCIFSGHNRQAERSSVTQRAYRVSKASVNAAHKRISTAGRKARAAEGVG